MIARLIYRLCKARKFGSAVAIWSVLSAFCRRIKILQGYATERKHDAIMTWLSKNYGWLISEYKQRYEVRPQLTNEGKVIPQKLWVCWWQGENAMPPLVKACYNSVLKYSNGYDVTLITKENYGDLLSIPEHIITKYNNGTITVTHLSDIIRMLLLANYGGMWLDATVLVTDEITFEEGRSFFTIRRDLGGKYVPKRKWAGNCIAGSQDFLLFNFVVDILCEYWKNFSEMIDYFLIDYAINLAYISIPEIQKAIDEVKLNNEGYMTLNRCLGCEYHSDFFAEVTVGTIFHKLSWKGKYSVITPDGKTSFYGYILNENSQ